MVKNMKLSFHEQLCVSRWDYTWTHGLQYKLFQSLDRRETIIVFRLNVHQTKFVCEVLVLGIRKKNQLGFCKRKEF